MCARPESRSALLEATRKRVVAARTVELITMFDSRDVCRGGRRSEERSAAGTGKPAEGESPEIVNRRRNQGRAGEDHGVPVAFEHGSVM